jgi:hypothetical protein
MMLAVHTGNTDATKGIVTVELETSSKHILDHKLDLVASNVA